LSAKYEISVEQAREIYDGVCQNCLECGGCEFASDFSEEQGCSVKSVFKVILPILGFSTRPIKYVFKVRPEEMKRVKEIKHYCGHFGINDNSELSKKLRQHFQHLFTRRLGDVDFFFEVFTPKNFSLVLDDGNEKFVRPIETIQRQYSRSKEDGSTQITFRFNNSSIFRT